MFAVETGHVIGWLCRETQFHFKELMWPRIGMPTSGHCCTNQHVSLAVPTLWVTWVTHGHSQVVNNKVLALTVLWSCYLSRHLGSDLQHGGGFISSLKSPGEQLSQGGDSVSWHQHQKSQPFSIFIYPQKILLTLPPVPVLSSSLLTGIPGDSITGMAHWRWADKQWSRRILHQNPFLSQPSQLTQAWDWHKIVGYIPNWLGFAFTKTTKLVQYMLILRVIVLVQKFQLRCWGWLQATVSRCNCQAAEKFLLM